MLFIILCSKGYYNKIQSLLLKLTLWPLNKLDEKLKKWFKNTFKFFDNDIKFILLLRNSVYRYECMDDWEKFSETTLPAKNEFCMKDITDAG